MSDSDSDLVEGVEATESPEPEEDLADITDPLPAVDDNSATDVTSTQDHHESQPSGDITGLGNSVDQSSIAHAPQSESENEINSSSTSAEQRNITADLVHTTESRNSLLAEDELNFNDEPDEDLSGAEWSLEPEDAVNFESLPCGAAAGGCDNNNSSQIAVDDEAESLRNCLCETESCSQIVDPSSYHRTESSSQLELDRTQYSNNVCTGGVDNSKRNDNVYQEQNCHIAAASDNADEWEQGSNPEEEDYRLQPEGEYVRDADLGNVGEDYQLEPEEDNVIDAGLADEAEGYELQPEGESVVDAELGNVGEDYQLEPEEDNVIDAELADEAEGYELQPEGESVVDAQLGNVGEDYQLEPEEDNVIDAELADEAEGYELQPEGESVVDAELGNEAADYDLHPEGEHMIDADLVNDAEGYQLQTEGENVIDTDFGNEAEGYRSQPEGENMIDDAVENEPEGYPLQPEGENVLTADLGNEAEDNLLRPEGENVIPNGDLGNEAEGDVLRPEGENVIPNGDLGNEAEGDVLRLEGENVIPNGDLGNEAEGDVLRPEGEYLIDEEVVVNETTEADQVRDANITDQHVIPGAATIEDPTSVNSDMIVRIPTEAIGKAEANNRETVYNNCDNSNIIPSNLNSKSEADTEGELVVGNGEDINIRAIPEDEIGVLTLERSNPPDMLDSEFYEPECDQSSVDGYQSDESNQGAIVDNQNDVVSDTILPAVQSSSGKPDNLVNICGNFTDRSTHTLADASNHGLSSDMSGNDSARQNDLESGLTAHEKTPGVSENSEVSHGERTHTGTCTDDTASTVDSSDNIVLHCDTENTAVNLDICNGAIPKQPFEKRKTSKDKLEKKAIPKYDSSNIQSQTDNKQMNNVPSDPNGEVEDELLTELDANSSLNSGTVISPEMYSTCNSAILSYPHTDQPDMAKCDQCRKNNVQCVLPSGLHSGDGDTSLKQDVRDLKKQLHQAKQLLLDRECDISRLKDQFEEGSAKYELLLLDRNTCTKELERLNQFNSDDLYLPQIKELEYTISQQQSEVKGLKDKLSSHTTSAKRAIAGLQNEMKLRIDQVTKMYEDANREKDSMVVKFAQAEHRSLEYMKQAERADGRVRESEKEKESIFLQLRAIKEQRKKLNCELESKNVELSGTFKELDKQRELVSSGNVRVKWAQNKLKAELEAHKDTKTQWDKTVGRLNECREEAEQIRRDCQAIVKTYQESEEVKSNSLDKELKLNEAKLLIQERERTSVELAHVKTQRELEQMAATVRECKKQNMSLREQISGVETEKDELLHDIHKHTELRQRHKKEIQDLREKVEHLVQVKGDFTRAQELIKTLDVEIADLKMSNKDLVADMEACRRREMDKLELTANLSRKNAELQSDNTTFINKVLGLTSELQNTKLEYQDADTKINELSDALANEQKLRREECQVYNNQLSGKAKAVADLSRRVEDERDEMKTLKRKHVNNVKDLTRQLQQVRRKLENYEANTNGDKDAMSLGSRTSSNGSLNTVGTDQPGPLVTPTVALHGQSVPPASRPPIPEQEYPVITEQVVIDKQVLIERIVKLQRALARRTEKIEFMDDHISQLVDEIQKKAKLIQNYVLREETGTMTSDMMDRSKAEIMKKHSIMGSVYSSHSTDHAMTFDLSLEINRKLQAVLEDTLLKNITLKESLETLGQEIARLSQENRRQQLHMQGKSRTRSKPSPR